MTNNQFWESYKKKCDEKGIAPLYKDAEEFAKAMTEPPKPYSTDDFTPNGESFDEGVVMWELDRMRYAAMGMEDVDEIPAIIQNDTILCEECGDAKDPSEFASRRGGHKSKICKTCMGKRISAGHAKNHSTTQKEIVIKVQEAIIATGTPLPLLKEQPVIKAISDETLRSMIVMAYKRGFDEGKMNALEPINHDEAMAFVEHYLRGCEYE